MEATHTDCPAYQRGEQDAGTYPLADTTAYPAPINCFQHGWNAGRARMEENPVVIAAACTTRTRAQGYRLRVVTSEGVFERETMRAYQFGAWRPGEKDFTVHLNRERAERTGAIVFEFSR